MEEKANALNNHKLSRVEIILMTILTPIIFCATFGAIHYLITEYCNAQSWFWGLKGLFAILGFTAAWVLIAQLPFKNYRKTKIFLMTMCLAVSISALINLVLDNLNIGHMFG